jgi:hypothetical protein
MNKWLFVFVFLSFFLHSNTAVNTTNFTLPTVNSIPDENTAENLYNECGLNGLISLSSFEKAFAGYEKYHPVKSILAICDFSKPSSQERFFVIDMENKKLLAHSLVAHGKNSGGLMATSFSNVPESLKSSLGFFRIGPSIMVPKHNLSLILEGLEPGINDNARSRGIIIHGADYVSEKFVKQYGYAGKSFGCPALPNELIPVLVPILENGALLYAGNE